MSRRLKRVKPPNGYQYKLIFWCLDEHKAAYELYFKTFNASKAERSTSLAIEIRRCHPAPFHRARKWRSASR